MSKLPLGFSKRRLRRLGPLVTMLLFIVLAVGSNYGWFEQAKQAAEVTQPGLYKVLQFDDGDTITVNMNNTKETVRFIGVDTPETHDPRKAVQCFGQAAADFTKLFIGDRPVRLEADPDNTNRDRYNRLLRYVYLPDGTLVNAEIIKYGYGFAYTSFPFGKAEEFKAYENEARLAGRGLWSSCQPYENEFGGYTSNDAQ